MVYNYIYKNKKRGGKVYSQVELENKDLELVFQKKKAVMENSEVLKKKK